MHSLHIKGLITLNLISFKYSIISVRLGDEKNYTALACFASIACYAQAMLYE